MDLKRKLSILADAAKYDASCASSGGVKRTSLDGKGMGSTDGNGICHSYTPDGRCVSLLKILLTNFCTYDCLYCVNRASSNVPRARFSIEEVVQLTLDFYSRNYIEGLFLSSGIIRDVDYTMEQLIGVARSLREAHDFRGYIHLKLLAGAAPELLSLAGRYADRVSVNAELAQAESLARLAPEKNTTSIRRAMAVLSTAIEASKDEPARVFAPSGQSTQVVVGADDTPDRTIIENSAVLYGAYRLRRVYYSAFSPIPDAASALPPQAPPLLREHRLYQADWLMRYYGFEAGEIFVRADGMLDLDSDPKLAWALQHREHFPVDVNRAAKEQLLRVPGLGTRAVQRILAARRLRTLHADDLLRLRVPLKRVLPFVAIPGNAVAGRELDGQALAGKLRAAPGQLSLFG